MLYWQTRRFEFISLDDPYYVSENPYIGDGLTWTGVRWAFSAHLLFPSAYADYYQPLTFLSRMLDLQLYGKQAGGHHLTNLCFHALNGVLVFWVLRRMTRQFWPSFAVAVVFAVHPLQVESVAWVTERNNLLVALFWLLACWAYVRYAEQPTRWRYAAVFGLFVLAILSKPPMAVMLPATLLLLDYWPLERLPTNPFGNREAWLILRSRLLEKVPFFAMSLAAATSTVVARVAEGAVTSSEHLPLTLRLANAAVSYCAYLGKVFWPADLSIIYPYPIQGIAPRHLLTAVLILAVITFWVIRQAPRKRHLPVGWLWFLAGVLPVIGLIQVGRVAMADRFVYLPILGLLIMVSWEVWLWASARPARDRPIMAALGLVALLLALQTYRHLPVWRNSTTLFSQALRVTTENYLAHSILGSALATEGKLSLATTHFAEAVRISPGFTAARYKLALALQQQRQFQKAADEFQRVLQQVAAEEDHNPAHATLAQEFTPELSEKPTAALVHADLGRVWIELGDLPAAEAAFDRAIGLAPRSAEAWHGRSVARSRQGRTAPALADARQCLALKPNYAEAHYNLGLLLAGEAKLVAAQQALTEAIRLQPGFADAYGELGSVLIRLDQLDEAIGRLTQAVALQPDLVSARNTVTKRFYPHWMIEGTGNYYYYTRDHLGSIRELIDSNRVVRARYDYDPYGRRSANQITFNAVEADFGYTGHFHHAPSGLALAPFRAYSADLGRWLSRDPIEEDGGVNLYGYVKCNPLNQIDVLGLAPLAQDEYFNMTGGVGSGFCQLTLGFSKDSTGQSYLSPGFSFGLGLPLSFTATTNKFHKNDKTSINNPASFLKEGSITATAACGKAYSASPTSDNRTAKGTGIGSPQIGAGWSWGFLWNKYQNK